MLVTTICVYGRKNLWSLTLELALLPCQIADYTPLALVLGFPLITARAPSTSMMIRSTLHIPMRSTVTVAHFLASPTAALVFNGIVPID